MKQLILSLMMALSCASASAGVIGFDDLPGDESLVANGYQGFNWDNIATLAASALPGSGYEAGTVSGANSAFNYNGGTATISKAGTFDFVGAFFTSAWFDQELAFEGLRDGQLVYSTDVSFLIDTTTPQWVQLGWNNIDTLVIYNSSGTPWAMDNFTVPEPGSVALIGLSLAGLLLARRRKQ
jgi:hypothetical protein